MAFEQVVVGNGADGVLNYLALALLEPGDQVAYCWPSFPVYPINAAKMGAVAVRAPLAGSSYDLDALAAVVSERTKLVYVTNPNNPTGGMVTRAALARFLDGLPEHVLPVLDEAYFEYIDDPEYPDGAASSSRTGAAASFCERSRRSTGSRASGSATGSARPTSPPPASRSRTRST